MRILHYARLAFKKCDLFSTTQFLRYQQEPEYKTASGGICSILVVAVFIGLFMNTALLTINKQIINWTSTSESLFDPVSTTISVEPQTNKFMFAVGIMGVNLNDKTQRFFDISLIQRHYIRGGIELYNETIQLVQCTQQHFNINDDLYTSYTTLPAYKWMCPPIGYNYTIYGKYTSPSMQMIEINVKKCNNSTDPSRPCVSDATIDQYISMLGQFTFSFFYVNPLINPGDSNYLNYYLQDRNYITFTKQLGSYSNGFIQDYSIITDNSLLPFPQNNEDDGIIIPQLFQNIVYQVTNDNYASFYLLKASSSTQYQRSFNKIDSFFSYVGGLVGTILGLMLIVQAYTEMSFELDLSTKLFQYKDNDNISLKAFNILTYCKFLVYEVLNYFGMCKNWNEMIRYDKCKQEIINQLDIQTLLNRINFLERAITTLFQENQLYGLHLQKFDSLDTIKDRRKYIIKYKRKQNQRGVQNQALSTESENKNDQSEQNSEKEKPPDNNTSMSYTMNMMKSLQNNNIETIIIDNMGELPNTSKHKDRIKKKSRSEQLQRLRREMEEGNTISKKIFEGIDPMYLEDFNKRESPQKIDKEKLGQSKLELVQVRGKQDEIPSRQKIDFQFITD